MNGIVQITKNPFLDNDFADFFSKIGNTFLYKNSKDISLYIYKRTINLMSFSNLPKVNISLPIIGIP